METKEYIQFITYAFQAKDSKIRQQQEDNLITTCQNDPQSIDKLIEITKLKEDQLIAESAAVTIITVIKKLISNQKPYPAELRLHHVELLVGILSQDISTKIKELIKNALKNLVNYDKQNIFTFQLQQHVKQSIESNKEELIIAALFISECLPQEKNYEWFQSVIKIGKQLTGFQNSTKILWAKTIHDTLDKFMCTKQACGIPEPIQEFFLYNDELCQSLLNFSQDMKDSSEYQYRIIGSMQLIITAALEKYPNNIQFHKCPMISILPIITDFLLKTLIAFTLNPNFNINMKQQEQNLVNEIVKILIVSAKQQFTYNLISEAKMAILVDIIYPFLSSNQEELDNLMNDPNEFVQLAQDTLNERGSDIPKTSIANLIDSLNRHIDGATSFITQFAIICSCYAITKLQQPVSQTNQFTILNEFQEHYFLKQMNVNILLETSLLILTIQVNQISHRQEIIGMFRGFLQEYGDYLLNYSLPIVKTRLCLFIGSLSKQLLIEQDQLKDQLLEFLISQLNLSNSQLYANCYCAVEALKQTIEEPKLTSILQPIINEILIKLSESLIESDFNEHFETIKIILKSFTLQPETIQKCVKQLVQKVKLEQDQVSEGQSERQICINQTMNIIKTIPEIESIIPNYFSLIENEIVVLYQYLENSENIDFDEDIVYLISQFISRTEFVTEHQFFAFKLFDKLIIKQKYMFGFLFETLNYMIKYGKNYFCIPQVQKKLIDYVQLILNSNEQGEACKSEGVLLLQLLIQEYVLSENILTEIFQITFLKSQQTVKNDFLKAKLMGVFISGLIQNCALTTKLLAQQQMLLDHMMHSYQYCSPGYDIKLYVIGFSTFFMNNTKQFNLEILHYIVFLLDKQYQYEQKRKESEEEDTDMFTYNEEEEEAKVSVETFLSSILKLDEFNVFQISYLQLKGQIDMHLILASDPVLQKDLDRLLKINKIDSDLRIIMKTKKLKRKNNYD